MSGNKLFLSGPLSGLLFGLLPGVLVLAGCSVRLDPGRDHLRLSPRVFDSLLSLAQLNVTGDTLTGFGDDRESYVAKFSEQLIEQNDLLTISILGDSSRFSKAVAYDDLKGYHQSLFLIHLRAQSKRSDPLDVAVYLAVQYDDRDKVLHTGPMYFGIVDKEEGHIDFLYNLKLTIHNKDTLLVPQTKLSRLQALKPGEFDTRIVFLADELITPDDVTWWKEKNISTIRVKKIVDYDPNKIGGKQPVVFSIPDVMRDETAIQFVLTK